MISMCPKFGMRGERPFKTFNLSKRFQIFNLSKPLTFPNLREEE